MRPTARWLIAAVLLLSAACVKQPDWIESTLVTVDVTGVWEGSVVGVVGGSAGITTSGRVLLDVEQEGPTVKGKLQVMTMQAARNSGPLEGRVGGDVFHFRARGGQNEPVTGEVTVSGDEMEGTLTLQSVQGLQTARISLRRVASPSRPQADRP